VKKNEGKKETMTGVTSPARFGNFPAGELDNKNTVKYHIWSF